MIKLPKPFQRKGTRIYWFTYKHPTTGKWPMASTGTDDEEQAKKYIAEFMASLAENRPMQAAPTLRTRLPKWTAERKARGVGSAEGDEARIEKYVLPLIGDMPLSEVRPKDIRSLVRKLRERTGEDKLAPRTVIHIYNTLHNLFADAEVDELVFRNPVKVKRGELPKKVDADPEWRSNATYTVREVERLISDAMIPPERRVQYALKAITGMRHGEVAALCWRHIDHNAEPLARINVVQAYSSTSRTIKSTKSEECRAVPLHPTLAKILATWKLTHWERIYGRKPTDDDYVVPARTLDPVNGADASHAMKDDFDALGLRKEAGKKRHRGGHDLRSWFETRCIEDGADSLIVDRFLHASDKSVAGGYQRFSWATLCREISKLKVETLGSEVLPLLAASLQAEKRAGARWTKLVTPKGLEPLFSA